MANERDTHFMGFADLLLKDLAPDLSALFIALGSPLSSRAEEIESAKRLLKLVLAQRAYDLLVHDRLNTGTSDLQHAISVLEAEEMVNGIPDLTEWPSPSPPAETEHEP